MRPTGMALAASLVVGAFLEKGPRKSVRIPPFSLSSSLTPVCFIASLSSFRALDYLSFPFYLLLSQAGSYRP